MADATLEPGRITQRISRFATRAWWRTGQIAGRAAWSFADQIAIDQCSVSNVSLDAHARQAFLTECWARHIPLVDALGDARWASFRDGYLYGWEMADA